jgi:hypothetical protein
MLSLHSSLRPGRLSTLIEQPNDQLQYVVADQLDSLRPAVKAGLQARTQTRTQIQGLYRKSVHSQ